MKYSTKAHSDEGQLDKMGETTVNSCRGWGFEAERQKVDGTRCPKKGPDRLGQSSLKPLAWAFLRPTQGRLGKGLFPKGLDHHFLMGWLIKIWRESPMRGMGRLAHPMGLFPLRPRAQPESDPV